MNLAAMDIGTILPDHEPGNQAIFQKARDLVDAGQSLLAFESIDIVLHQVTDEALYLHWQLAKQLGAWERGRVSCCHLAGRLLQRADIEGAFRVWRECHTITGRGFPIQEHLKLAQRLALRDHRLECQSVLRLALQTNKRNDQDSLLEIIDLASIHVPISLLDEAPRLFKVVDKTHHPRMLHAVELANQVQSQQDSVSAQVNKLANMNRRQRCASRFLCIRIKLEDIAAWGLNYSNSEGVGRFMSYDDVSAIVIAGIRRPNASAYVLIDLFIDPDTKPCDQRRLLRIDSRSIAPGRFFPTIKNPLDAFFNLAIEVHRHAEQAKRHPEGELSRRTLPIFSCLADYEQSFGNSVSESR